MNLPSFQGKPQEDLENFLEQLTNFPNVLWCSSRYLVAYLKQQVQADSRAYDTVRKAEEEHSSIVNTDDGTPPSNKHYLDYFKAIKETLLKKRGKPRDEKIRALLRDYYTMVQGQRDCPAVCSSFS